MKKGLFLFSFLFVLGIAAANAQSCASMSSTSGKSCCMTKAAAAKAAAGDASIEKRMTDDGAVAYVRKESDAQGNVKFVSVQYDAATSAFVNVAPQGAAAAEGQVSTGMVKKSCSAEEMKACAGKSEAKACAGKAEGKACCASKAKAVEQQ